MMYDAAGSSTSITVSSVPVLQIPNAPGAAYIIHLLFGSSSSTLLRAPSIFTCIV